jgi:integrase
MSKIPYLFRRRNVFYFRVAVPADLRETFQCREVIRTLKTEKRAEAVPLALGMAAQVTKLFNDAKMTDIKQKRREQALRDKLRVLELLHQEEREQKDFDHTAEIRRVKAESALKAENELLKNMVAEQSRHIHAPAPAPKLNPNIPKLSSAIDAFMAQYDPTKAGMRKKHQTALPKFLEFIGDKPIDQIKNVEINRFFASLAQHHNSSFKNYKSSIKQLIEWARALYEGAFEGVYITEVKYSGTRKEREHSQRSFKDAELLRVFTCDKMQEYCSSGADVHKFWLPAIGLYSGARLNELCQLNPFTDILQGESGIWYFHITEDTEAAEGVSKSVKTDAGKRVVPIHSRLTELGFLDYVENLKSAGHKRLFPQWKVARGRAGANAGKDFVRFIADIGLRDETKGKNLTGMHAFRKTALTRAYKGKFIKEMLPIVGHESDLMDETGKALPAVTMGYIDDDALEIPLTDKKATIEKLQFDIPFYKPVKPVFKK